ncbi:FYVE, RhoGEF and PH domain-containing protein 5-like isoform X1, partial [Lates japonicus]
MQKEKQERRRSFLATAQTETRRRMDTRVCWDPLVPTLAPLGAMFAQEDLSDYSLAPDHLPAVKSYWSTEFGAGSVFTLVHRNCFCERDVGDIRFAKMNTDCTKPSVAPKPRFVCHASLKLPSPLMSAARGPKPSIAPKPKVTPELNGNQGGCSNGGLLTSDSEVDEEHETENRLNKAITAEEQFNAYILKSPQKDLQNVSPGPEDGEVTEEEKEEEEDMIQKMDEDWRLTDSAVTEEVDSLETLWDYVEIGNTNEYDCDDDDENKVRMCQKRTSEEHKAHTAEALLNHLDCQPRFRLVSISVPTDTDTSLTSSLSESQLLSPNDSDVFRDEDDLEGHIVPFLDDTTDAEQDISDEHVYEEPRHSSEGEHVFPFDRKATGMRSHSLSHRTNNNVAEMGVQFVQRSYMSGFGQPALSSSPMLSSMRHKSYSKPHYLSLYPRSLSMEGQEMPLCVYRDREESQRQKGAICSSGSFSRRSPLSSSGLSTPTSVVDIPPPFELAYITKRPITKSSPSLLIEGDSSEKNRKKKSSIKRFLMLKFRRKTESKSVVDVNPSSFKSSAESSHHTPSRLLDLDRHSLSGSPQLNSRSASKPQVPSEPASTFLFYKESKRKGNSVAFLNRSVVRVESFEDRSRVPFIPLPLTKPRSISFPNTDTSDYENVPAISSDYENLQVPQRRPVRQGPFTDFFDRPSCVLSSANDTDGYVDMSSLPGFKSKTQSPEEETESAYTEAYNVCAVAVGPQTGSAGDVRGEMVGEEDQGRTSEEEDGGADSNYDRQPDGRSRAFYIAKELVDTERLHVKALKLLQEDFREAVGAAVGDEGEPVLEEERLREILNELPDVYSLHRRILTELENRIRHWEESQRIADIFLCRKAEFLVFTTYIGHYDRSMNLLEDSSQTSPAFAAIVHQFEQSPAGKKVSLKHQLLQVIVRVAQYRMLLTDYLNNLSPDSKEYEDTQAAVAIVSDVADQVNDSLKHGENLLRLVNIEVQCVHGQRDLLQPGRMNDVLLSPTLIGRKYRLKNSALIGLQGSDVEPPQISASLFVRNTTAMAVGALVRKPLQWSSLLSSIHPPSILGHRKGTVTFNQ